MKMKSKNKVIIITLLVLLSVICAYKIVDLTNYHFVEARAVNYLCDKYDADKDEFELIDCKHSEIYWITSGEIAQSLAWNDFSFEFKYKDKNFFTNRYKGKFYDDYQIDDIEKWCTEWLQENVDENIVGISFNSISIADCLRRTNMTNKHVFTENDAEIFLMNCYSKKGYPTYISYHLDDFKYEERIEISNSISNTINDRLSSDEQFKAGITNDTNMDKSILKWKYGYWIVDYSVSYVK